MTDERMHRQDESLLRTVTTQRPPPRTRKRKHSAQLNSSEAGSCCKSLASNHSMELPEKFSQEPKDNFSSKLVKQMCSLNCIQLDSIFKDLEKDINLFTQKELKKLQKMLSKEHPESLGPLKAEKEEQRSSSKAFLKITVNFLRERKQNHLADCLLRRSCLGVCQDKLKCNLRQNFKCVFEGIAKAGNATFLRDIYTEQYITEREPTENNQEHEVRHMETASKNQGQSETIIRCVDIFKSPWETNRPNRTLLMTKGVAGIGKTVLTQKLSLDWAEDKEYEHIQLLFPFTFRALNMYNNKDTKISFVGLVDHFFNVKETELLCFEDLQVLIILDGLDECRLRLDFKTTKTMSNPTECVSIEVLLVNLIRGSLLPFAHIWITTRPAAADQIPAQCITMMTEVRGFSESQKEQYFRKKFSDDADRIISHIKTIRSLHIMCFMPIFCWMTSTVLEHVLKINEDGVLPKSLTQIYIYFLVIQAKVKNIKYDRRSETDPHWSPETTEMVQFLGKLAFMQLQKGNLMFYESDLSECGLEAAAASKYSGLFTQVFKEESGLYQDKVFCFIHLSMQEFLAALHVHQTFVNTGVNLLSEKQTSLWTKIFTGNSVQFYQTAVDQALQSPNGRLDLFLRFLLGLSLTTNQNLLQGLLTQTRGSSQTNQKTAAYIKQKLSEGVKPEPSINLFHCLNELNDCSLVEQIQQYLKSGQLSGHGWSAAQWSALAFILLSSEKDLDQFELRKYSASEEALLRLLPVVKASHKALLSDCNLSERSCGPLSSILNSSSLRVLDLSKNTLKDTGLKILCAGLMSPECRLEQLRLSACMISEDGCASLDSALRSNPSHLRYLDLTYNHPGKAGVKLLSALQEDPKCALDSLKLIPGGDPCLHPIRRYFDELTLNPITAHRELELSENNKKATRVSNQQPYPDHPDRFDFRAQLLCCTDLVGYHYWEVQWSGEVYISVSYKGIGRKGNRSDSGFGFNAQSWCLYCSGKGFFAWHEETKSQLHHSSSSSSGTVAVYVDYAAGSLTFYTVSSDQLIHLHTFHAKFTEPLLPGFALCSHGSTVLLSALPGCDGTFL